MLMNDERDQQTHLQSVGAHHAVPPGGENGSTPAVLEHEHHASEAGVQGEHEHEHHNGFVHVFRERAISLRTMERPLRLITGLAIAQLIVAAILIATRNVPMPTTVVLAQNNQLIQMPVPIFLVSLVFLALAWSYMLAGMLHTHPLVRVVGLAIFTLVVLPLGSQSWSIAGFPIGVYMGSFGFLTLGNLRWAWLAVIGVVAALWALGLLTWLLDRRVVRAGSADRWHHSSRVQLHTFGLVLVLVCAIYALAWAGAAGVGSVRMFNQGVSLQLQSLSFFLVPVLFLAGTDFAEWGQVTGERVAEVTGRVRPPALLAALTALVALAILADALWLLRGEILVQLGLGAIVALALLALWALARHRHGLPLHVPIKALAGVAVVYVLIISYGAGLVVASQQAKSPPPKFQLGGVPVPYRHTRQPHFSIDYPSLWEVQAYVDHWPSTPVVIGFSGVNAHEPASFFVVEAGASAEHTLARFRQDWFTTFLKGAQAHYTPAPAHAGWEVTQVTLTGRFSFKGLVWERRVNAPHGSYFVLLNGLVSPSLYTLHVPIFMRMVDSWRPVLVPEQTQESATGGGDTGESGQVDIFTLSSRFWALATVLAGAVLVIRARRGRTGPLASGALLVVLVGIIFILENLSQELAAFGVPQDRVPHFRLGGMQASIALVTLLALGWLAVRRHLTVQAIPLLAALLTLNIAFQILVWIFNLYSTAADVGGRFTIAQAIVIMLALLWDIVMSGEAITNVRGRLFPRHTRVLLFFGYIMLVSSAVLYFSSLQVQATSATIEPQFETEGWPQLGLGALGVPLLLALFALQAGRWLDRGGARPGAHPASHGQEKPEEAAIMPASSHHISLGSHEG